MMQANVRWRPDLRREEGVPRKRREEFHSGILQINSPLSFIIMLCFYTSHWKGSKYFLELLVLTALQDMPVLTGIRVAFLWPPVWAKLWYDVPS